MNLQTKAEILLGRIFFAVIFTVLSFLLVDYVSTWFLSNRSPIERKFPVEHTRHPKPYVMFGGMPYGGTLNANGYVGKVPEVPKEKNEVRLFMLGGSTVIAGNPPIAQLLEEQFSLNGLSHVKVYNYGVVSSGSGQDLARIVYEVSELDPDLIIFYNGANDFNHPRDWDPRPGYPFNFIAYERNPLVENDVGEYPSLAMLAYGSNMLRILVPSYFVEKFVSLDEVRKQEGWMTEPWKEKIASIYVENLAKASKISNAFGAEFIAFFQPVLYFKDHLTDEEKRLARDGLRKYTLEMREKILSKIEKVKKRDGILIVDLSHIYEKVTEWVFRDRVHTRQSSKKLVAEQIFKQVIDRRLVENNGENFEHSPN